jgi:peroxiredoxin
MKACIIILTAFFFMSCSSNRGKVATGLEGKSLPEFQLALADSTTPFSTASIPSGKPFLILWYQPYCPFCQAQMADIVNNIKNMNNLTIYMVSSSPKKDVQDFVDKYKLLKYTGIKIVADGKSQIGGYFQPKGVPFFAFYGANRKLKEARIGKQDIGVLIDNAEN